MVLVDKLKFFKFYMNSKGEKPKRQRKMKKKTNSNSKVFKCIVHCLKNHRYVNVLSWTQEEKGIFKVIFLHQHNKKWSESMLSPFKAIEKALSAKRYEKYRESPKYSESCKTRFRANLNKLVRDAGALHFLGEKVMSDKSKERSYKIVNYSDQFITDLLKDSKVGEKIESICETDANTRKEKVEVESQVAPHRSGGTSTNDFAFPQVDGNFIVATNPIQMETDSEFTERPTLNMLYTPDDPALYNSHMENMFVRTVSVPYSRISAIPQNNIVQTAHNGGVMQSSPLCCNLGFNDYFNDPSEFNDMQNASLHSSGVETHLTKMENYKYDDYLLPESEESYNLSGVWSQDSNSSMSTLENPFLSSTVDMYNEKTCEYPDTETCLFGK